MSNLVQCLYTLSNKLIEAYGRQWPSLDQLMTCCRIGTKLMSELMMTYWQLDRLDQTSVKLEPNTFIIIFIQENTLKIVVYKTTVILSGFMSYSVMLTDILRVSYHLKFHFNSWNSSKFGTVYMSLKSWSLFVKVKCCYLLDAMSISGPLFTKRTEVLSQDLEKSRNLEIPV